MRIWGYVLLGIGVLFLVLFGLAALGGANLGVIPFFVSVMVITIGWNFRTSGKGILRADPSATPAAIGAQPETAQPEVLTVEMPLTPEVAASIARRNASTRRTLLYLSGGFFVIFAAIGAVSAAMDKTPGEGSTFLLAFSGLGVLCACMIYGLSWLTKLLPVGRDLHGTTYLQTTGPVSVVPFIGGATLRLADRAFLMNGRGGMAELSKLDWGRVDYSPHGHIILGAWDREGRSVYCLPGYRVETSG